MAESLQSARRRWESADRTTMMTKNPTVAENETRARELLDGAAAAELRLLKQERKAERRLAEAIAGMAGAEARLRKAQELLQSRREDVAAAEAELRECQARRAVGPVTDSC
jgi:hypothetical protein